MRNPPRARIRAAFERAAQAYDSAADVQRRICRRMAAALPESPAVRRILDAGCGTGFALPLLAARYPAAQLLALDLSPGMLGRVSPDTPRIAADIEHLPLADGCLDLFWSSLTVQWCDLGTVLAEARRALRPGGRLAVATLGPRTFHELRHAFARADAHTHTLGFLTDEAIAAACAAAGWHEVRLCKHEAILHYSDLKTLLRAIKAVGANQLGTGRRAGLMSRAAFTRAETAWNALRTPEGLPLTYDIIEIHAQR